MASPDGRSFELIPVGPFSLEASTRFLEGFTPAAHSRGGEGHLHLALAIEGSWATVGVCVRQEGRRVIGEVVGDPAGGAAADQVARILSLDVDARGFGRIAKADPVVASLQGGYPGLRPVLFWSPYEAAAWALIGRRLRRRGDSSTWRPFPGSSVGRRSTSARPLRPPWTGSWTQHGSGRFRPRMPSLASGACLASEPSRLIWSWSGEPVTPTTSQARSVGWLRPWLTHTAWESIRAGTSSRPSPMGGGLTEAGSPCCCPPRSKTTPAERAKR